jgi:hypothetical protein
VFGTATPNQKVFAPIALLTETSVSVAEPLSRTSTFDVPETVEPATGFHRLFRAPAAQTVFVTELPPAQLHEAPYISTLDGDTPSLITFIGITTPIVFVPSVMVPNGSDAEFVVNVQLPLIAIVMLFTELKTTFVVAESVTMTFAYTALFAADVGTVHV